MKNKINKVGMIKRVLVVFMLLATTHMMGQFNDYKYVVLPYKFDGFKKDDQYRLNTKLRYLLKNKGFNVLFDTENFPADLALNRCNALYANLEKDSGLLRSGLMIVFRDCNKKEVARSLRGSSKEKDLNKAYSEALEEAFMTLGIYEYKYNGTHDVATIAVEQAADKVEANAIEKTSDALYMLNGVKYRLTTDDELVYRTIVNHKTKTRVGVIIRSSQKGVYHIRLNESVGMGYYDATGNFNIEVLTDNGQVELSRLQLLN